MQTPYTSTQNMYTLHMSILHKHTLQSLTPICTHHTQHAHIHLAYIHPTTTHFTHTQDHLTHTLCTYPLERQALYLSATHITHCVCPHQPPCTYIPYIYNLIHTPCIYPPNPPHTYTPNKCTCKSPPNTPTCTAPFHTHLYMSPHTCILHICT